MGFFGVVSGMKVGSSLRGGGVGVWVEGRFVAEEPEPTIEQNMLAEFVYIQLGGDVGDQRKFCDPGSLRVGTGGLDNIPRAVEAPHHAIQGDLERIYLLR